MNWNSLTGRVRRFPHDLYADGHVDPDAWSEIAGLKLT